MWIWRHEKKKIENACQLKHVKDCRTKICEYNTSHLIYEMKVMVFNKSPGYLCPTYYQILIVFVNIFSYSKSMYTYPTESRFKMRKHKCICRSKVLEIYTPIEHFIYLTSHKPYRSCVCSRYSWYCCNDFYTCMANVTLNLQIW